MKSVAARSDRKSGCRSQVTEVKKNVRSDRLSIPQRLKPPSPWVIFARLEAVRFYDTASSWFSAMMGARDVTKLTKGFDASQNGPMPFSGGLARVVFGHERT